MFNDKPDYESAVQLVIEAREHLNEAIDALRMLTREVPEMKTRVETYLISTLEQAISEDNEWLGGSNSANLAALEAELAAAELDDLAARTEPEAGDQLLIRFNNELVGVTVIGDDDVKIITETDGVRITIPRERAAATIVENMSL